MATFRKPQRRQANDASMAMNFVYCDHGDPIMYERFWQIHKNRFVFVNHPSDRVSYLCKNSSYVPGLPCYMSGELEGAIREIHDCIGNAVVNNKTIVVGNGSSQILTAALFALANRDEGAPSTAVVAAAPYCSLEVVVLASGQTYPNVAEHLATSLFHWAGDANTYQPKEGEAVIEFVTTPNNPCGSLRNQVVVGAAAEQTRGRKSVVHDMSYYWPSFTPITEACNHDVMIFTLANCIGHAGVHLAWAIVKNPAVAGKMTEYIVRNTVGVSHDTQNRAAVLLRATFKGYEDCEKNRTFYSKDLNDLIANCKFFHYGNSLMESRWERVRGVLAGNAGFSLPEPNEPDGCTFLGTYFSTHPAFMWLKSEKEGSNCQLILKRNGILGLGGEAFGVSAQYARISLVNQEAYVDALVGRLPSLRA